MSNVNKATKKIMAVFDEIRLDTMLHDDTFDTIASAKVDNNKKRKLESNQELEPEQVVMTTDEAVMLALAASQYYTNQNTDGDYDGLARSGTFGWNVYKKARDVLKPKYKELFDVKAIAKSFKKLADNAWD